MPEESSAAVPKDVDPRLKTTVPVGTAVPMECFIVAVNVTLAPCKTCVAEGVRVVVVGIKGATVALWSAPRSQVPFAPRKLPSISVSYGELSLTPGLDTNG